MKRAEQGELFDHGHKYDAFVKKFEPKKTTDDCYTPEPIYEAVAGWVAEEYGAGRETFVRPFWPGGNYEEFEYPPRCVVVDNPPFSILSKIVKFYNERGIRFFLFAPHLTLFTNVTSETSGIVTGVSIVYANGAVVNTDFLTNMDAAMIRTAPVLYRRIKEANRKQTKELPKYRHAKNILMVSMLEPISRNGIEFAVSKNEAEKVRTIDAMNQIGKQLYGSGFILGDKAAAAKEAAAKEAEAKEAAAKEAAAKEHTFELSERERAIVEKLNGTDGRTTKDEITLF